MADNTLTLVELNTLVRKGIEGCLPDTYWIQAELSDVRINTSGHCYLEFIQKEEGTSSLIAKARGMIWANRFNFLRPYFEQTTGETLHSGLKVLVEVSVNFHELYGYSLVVQNIDPTYTIGDLVKRREKIIKQLEVEGVLTLNKELEFPLLAQRIAVISSATAAGYDDFCSQLKNNEWGISFFVELFPAIMQGDRVEKTILSALDQILERRADFDVVVIIRGGGATSDLSGFDTYLLAASCAQFPLPIITGIGHERDDTVLDLVANQRVKTPTAAAEFLIGRMIAILSQLDHLSNRLKIAVKSSQQREKEYLDRISSKLPALVNYMLVKEHHKLDVLSKRLKQATISYIKDQKHLLNSLTLKVNSGSPDEVLKKGYALLLDDDKIITSINDIRSDSELKIRLKDGTIKVTIKKVWND